MLNNDQILSAIRWVLTALGTYVVSRGWISTADSATAQSEVLTIFGALLPLVAFFWSMFHHATPPVTPPPPPPLKR